MNANQAEQHYLHIPVNVLSNATSWCDTTMFSCIWRRRQLVESLIIKVSVNKRGSIFDRSTCLDIYLSSSDFVPHRFDQTIENNWPYNRNHPFYASRKLYTCPVNSFLILTTELITAQLSDVLTVFFGWAHLSAYSRHVWQAIINRQLAPILYGLWTLGCDTNSPQTWL